MSTTATTAPTAVRPSTFFALTFGLSWAVWVPLMLIRLDVLPRVVPLDSLTALALPGVLVPAVAATVLTGRAAGSRGIARLWAKLRRWRVGWWWLPVLGLQPVLLVAAALVSNLSGAGSSVHVLNGLTASALVTTAAFLAVASTGEEVGWRGLALPALQSGYGATRASIVLGLATATWHLPYWVLQGALADRGATYLVLDYVFIVALSFQLTWLVDGAGGSVLVAVAFHLVFNIVNVAILPVTGSTGAFAVLTAAECVVAVAILDRLHSSRPHLAEVS